MAIIKDLLGYILKIDQTSQAARVTLYDSAGVETAKEFTDFGAAGNLPFAIDSIFEYNNTVGYDTISFNMTIPTGATVVFESTIDNVVWNSILLRRLSTDAYVSTSTTSDRFSGSITGMRKFRVRVSVAGTVIGGVIGRVSRNVNTINAGINLNTSSLNLEATQAAISAKLPATLGQKEMVTSMSVVVASNNTLATKDLKDTGRNQTNYFMVLPIITSAVDSLMSLTGYKGGVAVATTTTPAVVTTAKTYRINSITINYIATATAGTALFSLRANLSGVVAITSPVVANWVIGTSAATAGIADTMQISFPDGIEFPAGTGIGISMVGLNATQVAAIVGYGQVTIHGFEY